MIWAHAFGLRLKRRGCLQEIMAESITFFHVSDIHFGVEDKAAHDWFAQAVARERPDVVICTGDLTQRAKRREFSAAQGWLAGLGVPVVLEPGNHDLPYYNLAERFFTPFARYDALAKAVAGQVELPGIALIALRTTVSAQWRFPWSDGVVRDAALARTVHELERLDGDGGLKIVMCHHPLIGKNSAAKNPTIHGDRALAALAAAGADVVLSGHIHDAFDLTREIAGRNVRLIGAGTLSIRLRSSQPSYNIMRWDGTTLNVTRRTLEPVMSV